MPSPEFLERIKFFEASINVLELERTGVDENETQSYIESIAPTASYPINQLLEDFVETSSIRTLQYIHKLLDKHPLMTDNPESTKMGALKIFNLFSRRQHDCDCVGTENMARFMLLVAGSVKISDRSGVNLKGDPNCAHFKITEDGNGGNYSPLVKAICDLQEMLYSENNLFQSANRIYTLVNSITGMIASSLVESDDLLDGDSLLKSAPYFLLDGASSAIDPCSAIIILTQCLFLIDSYTGDDLDSKGLTRQIIGLLKKTVIGKRIVKMLPLINSSDQKWRKWKREQQCKDLSQPPFPVALDSEYFRDTHPCEVKIVEDDIDLRQDTPTEVDAIVESDWAKARRAAFGDFIL